MWHDRDRIVLKALTLVLEQAFAAHISSAVYHRQGGMKIAIRTTQDYLKGSPDSWIMKSGASCMVPTRCVMSVKN